VLFGRQFAAVPSQAASGRAIGCNGAIGFDRILTR